MRIQQVLMVCSGNTCRSPMAAAMLTQLWAGSGAPWPLQVTSAGTHAMAGLDASHHAVTAMDRRNVDVTGHRSAVVDDRLMAQADLVLTMTERHKEYLTALWPAARGRVYTLGEYAGTKQDVPDPYGGALHHYEMTAQALEQLLRSVVRRIQKEGSSA